jgi:hypothetical protein
LICSLFQFNIDLFEVCFFLFSTFFVHFVIKVSKQR